MRRPTLCVLRYPKDESLPFHYWTVSGYRQDGKRKRLFFKDRKEAERKLKEILTQQRREGTAARYLSEELRVLAIKCTDQLRPYGKTIGDATSHYLEYLADTAKPNITAQNFLRISLDIKPN
jgi:hypothetical protein